MGNLTQTTAQVQTDLDAVEASNAGLTSITDLSDTTATAAKKSGFHSLQASSSNAPSTDRAVMISAVRNTSASSQIRYGQILITESNGLWFNSDNNGTLGTWSQVATVNTAQTISGAKTITGNMVFNSATLDVNGNELILDADGDTSITADTDDQIDVKIAGADDFQFTANTFTALSGSTIKANTIAETTSASGVTIDGVLLKDSTSKTGTLTVGSGSITDSGGTISLGSTNLTLGTGDLTVSAGDVTLTSGNLGATGSSSTLTLGTNASTTGRIRIGNNTAIKARNAANTADVNLTFITSGDVIQVGDNVAGVSTSLSGGDVSIPNGDLTVSTGDVKIPGGFLNFGAAESLTVTSNTISPTQTRGQVTAAGATATVNTITGTTIGDVLILIGTSGKTITFADGVDNLRLPTDRVLTAAGDTLTLSFDGASWVELSYADNS